MSRGTSGNNSTFANLTAIGGGGGGSGNGTTHTGPGIFSGAK